MLNNWTVSTSIVTESPLYFIFMNMQMNINSGLVTRVSSSVILLANLVGVAVARLYKTMMIMNIRKQY